MHFLVEPALETAKLACRDVVIQPGQLALRRLEDLQDKTGREREGRAHDQAEPADLTHAHAVTADKRPLLPSMEAAALLLRAPCRCRCVRQSADTACHAQRRRCWS